jgi:FAD/FMN-containing dehydrogenase
MGNAGPSCRIEPRFDAGDIAEFKQSLRGSLVLPNDADYERARAVWNGMVDKRPAIIAYCVNPADVVSALGFARRQKVSVSVRSGGHNIAGSSVCDDGLVIDLSRMKRVEIDPDRRVVHAAAGLTLGEFDTATQRFGLATTMGVNSDTGMAGLTLGGGFGKLGRAYGLACDNLVSAEIVTADGRFLLASETKNCDLFWGIRGGGGNFGVATALTFRLHPVGPEMLRASLAYDQEHARDAMRFYRDLAAAAPEEVSADASLSMGFSGGPVFGITLCYAGPAHEGAHVLDRLLAPLRASVRATDEVLGLIPYLAIQSAGDAVFPRGRRYYWKAQFLREISDEFIDVLLDRFPASPSPRALVVFQQVGGAIARVSPDATAYGNRDAAFDCFPISIWDSPADDPANVAWAQELWTALRPFSTGGVYVNNLGEEGDERVRAAYGDNLPRLIALKEKYDPMNVFCMNQNIRRSL